MNRPARRQGVTLIELMVGIAILGIVMGGAYKILTSAASIARQQQDQALSTRRAWTTLQQITREIRGVYEHNSAKTVQGTNASVSRSDIVDTMLPDMSPDSFPPELPDDVLRLTTHELSRDGTGDAGTIEYMMQHSPDDNPTGLYRRSAPSSRSIEDAPWELYNEQAIGLDLQYQRDDGQWTLSWNDDSIPRAIKVSVLMTQPSPDRTSGARLTTFQTTVHLPSAGRVQP